MRGKKRLKRLKVRLAKGENEKKKERIFKTFLV